MKVLIYPLLILHFVFMAMFFTSCKDDKPGSNPIKQSSVPSKWRDEVEWGRNMVLKVSPKTFKERKVKIRVLKGDSGVTGPGGSGVRKINGADRGGYTKLSGNNATITVFSPVVKYTDQHIKHEAVHAFEIRSGHPKEYRGKVNNWR